MVKKKNKTYIAEYEDFLPEKQLFEFSAATLLTQAEFEHAQKYILQGAPTSVALKSVGIGHVGIEAFKLYTEMMPEHENARIYNYLIALENNVQAALWISLKTKADASDSFDKKIKYLREKNNFDRLEEERFSKIQLKKERY